jgi:hypothetical protein
MIEENVGMAAARRQREGRNTALTGVGACHLENASLWDRWRTES